MGFIYRLTSPYGKSYIGQTFRPIEERFKEHQTRSDCVAISRAIQFHGWHNMKKEWIEVRDDDLNFYEEMLVALLGTLSPGGYNLKEGGSNGKPSIESREKMSKAQKGKILTKDHKQKISKSMSGEKHHFYGQAMSDEQKQKMSISRKSEKNPMFGKNHTADAKQKMSNSSKGESNPRSKKVYQYELDGTFVQSFTSSGEAARCLNKSDGTNIRRCANGDYASSYGFKWSYTKL
ncbi:hypothetical protein ATCV1_Z637L [Acanthocystis turfacea chlorella virus 1]|uniref:Uncharacterized protein Z637L n=1 Tax=Chlorovirus heliozoae TaxID=322019 RepID=A7K9P7_9PHYC|nr:hypothetical protein ATCV1_Z637L [Acanthocystis turfacea chlorella virus 1]ABT16771.1 hypothetical protein ATCV1_Z637L [Acanthocystis turfacea chlorella virus 1]